MLLNQNDKLDFDMDLNRFETGENTQIDYTRTQDWEHVQNPNNIKILNNRNRKKGQGQLDLPLEGS